MDARRDRRSVTPGPPRATPPVPGSARNGRRLATLAAGCGLAALLAVSGSRLASMPQPEDRGPLEGALIRVDRGHRITITPMTAPAVRLPSGEEGIVVWVENGGERWEAVRGTWAKPAAARDRATAAAKVRRGPGGDTAAPTGLSQLTTQLEPLMPVTTVMRDIAPAGASAAFVTPPDGGRLLNPRLTVRRRAAGAEALPGVTAVLSGEKASARVPLPAGRATVPFAELAGLPDDWREGLPAGQYTLSLGEAARVAFVVEPADRRRAVTKPLEEWAALLGGEPRPLYVQLAVDHLTAGEVRPYLADALDLLDELPERDRMPYLSWRRLHVLWLLRAGAKPDLPGVARSRTGIADVDKAREMISRGWWAAALAVLDGLPAAAGPRALALAELYRAVIRAESAPAGEEEVEASFRKALAALRDQSAADRLRGHNDYANFLLGRTQDRLYNHAFQMAAGVRPVFVTALASWDRAREQYEAALALAPADGPSDDRAAVLVNLARAYAVLADVVRTLDSPDEGRRRFAEVARSADGAANDYLGRATAGPAPDDPLVRAAADGLRAELAFRRRDAVACLGHARHALADYVRAGSLVGAEGAYRLLGLCQLRAPEFEGGRPPDAEARHAALRLFRVSCLLADRLRDRLPAERVGMTRAGFFARREYVSEQVVDLLLADGADAEALRHAELAKSRALQDLLTVGGRDAAATPRPARDFGVVLAAWPADVVALEYFLGADRARVFAVTPGGKVRAYTLADASGRPIAPADLVARVRAFLADLDGYAAKQRDRLLAGQGFDHGWQDALDRFRRELIPDDLLAELRRARAVVIVPHHILHYFPFAALVTRRDAEPRDALEMVRPRFLVDEPCDICYAPSLTVRALLQDRPNRPVEAVAALGIADLPGAPPLAGVAAEVRSARRAFGDRVTRVLTGPDASRDAAEDLLREPGVLLVCTHGRNLPDRPLQSELLLYPHEGDDGRLTAERLYAGEVDRDLVVLSACHSGLADKSPMPGDDLFGLQRALLQAGGRTVVSGQWDIYDRTGPELMGGFFDHFAAGEPAPRALANAQREFLQKLRASANAEPWLHPYFWAVYTATGDDRTAFKR